jgi:hypothetical protein
MARMIPAERDLTACPASEQTVFAALKKKSVRQLDGFSRF